FFSFQAEDGIRYFHVTGVQTCALPIYFVVVLLVIFSTQILGFFDGVLVAIESQYRNTAPALLPLQMQDIPLEQDVGAIEAAKKRSEERRVGKACRSQPQRQ